MDGTTFDLEVSNISGYFTTGEVIVGSASSASYEIRILIRTLMMMDLQIIQI